MDTQVLPDAPVAGPALPPPAPVAGHSSLQEAVSSSLPDTASASVVSASPALHSLLALPADVFWLFVSFADARSLIALGRASLAFYRVLNEHFWQQYFIQRWGHAYRVGAQTRVSAELPRACGSLSSLCSSGDFLWHFIEFGFNAPTVPRAPGVDWGTGYLAALFGFTEQWERHDAVSGHWQQRHGYRRFQSSLASIAKARRHQSQHQRRHEGALVEEEDNDAGAGAGAGDNSSVYADNAAPAQPAQPAPGPVPQMAPIAACYAWCGAQCGVAAGPAVAARPALPPRLRARVGPGYVRVAEQHRPAPHADTTASAAAFSKATITVDDAEAAAIDVDLDDEGVGGGAGEQALLDAAAAGVEWMDAIASPAQHAAAALSASDSEEEGALPLLLGRARSHDSRLRGRSIGGSADDATGAMGVTADVSPALSARSARIPSSASMPLPLPLPLPLPVALALPLSRPATPHAPLTPSSSSAAQAAGGSGSAGATPAPGGRGPAPSSALGLVTRHVLQHGVMPTAVRSIAAHIATAAYGYSAGAAAVADGAGVGTPLLLPASAMAAAATETTVLSPLSSSSAVAATSTDTTLAAAHASSLRGLCGVVRVAGVDPRDVVAHANLAPPLAAAGDGDAADTAAGDCALAPARSVTVISAAQRFRELLAAAGETRPPPRAAATPLPSYAAWLAAGAEAADDAPPPAPLPTDMLMHFPPSGAELPSAAADDEEERDCLWKHACWVQEHTRDELELRQCALCDKIDVYDADTRRSEAIMASTEHSSATWVRPCACPLYSHRACVETRVLQQGLLRCQACGEQYETAHRLPMTPAELVRATWADRARVARGILCTNVPFFLFCLLLVVVCENAHAIGACADAAARDAWGVELLREPFRSHPAYGSAQHAQAAPVGKADAGACSAAAGADGVWPSECAAPLTAVPASASAAGALLDAVGARVYWGDGVSAVSLSVADALRVGTAPVPAHPEGPERFATFAAPGAGATCAWESISLPAWAVYPFLLLQHQLFMIYFSPRLRAAVHRVWASPFISSFLRLFFFFVVNVTFLEATFVRVEILHALAVRTPWPLSLPVFWAARAADALQQWLAASTAFAVLSYVSLAMYLVSAAILIYIYWRTHYRIQTLRTYNAGTILPSFGCLMCSMGMCIDSFH